MIAVTTASRVADSPSSLPVPPDDVAHGAGSASSSIRRAEPTRSRSAASGGGPRRHSKVGAMDPSGDRQAGCPGTGRLGGQSRIDHRGQVDGRRICPSAFLGGQHEPDEADEVMDRRIVVCGRPRPASSRMAISQAANSSRTGSVASTEVTASVSASGFRSRKSASVGSAARTRTIHPSVSLPARPARPIALTSRAPRRPGVLVLSLVSLVVDDDCPDRQVHPVGKG